MKYQSSNTHCSTVISKVKVSEGGQPQTSKSLPKNVSMEMNHMYFTRKMSLLDLVLNLRLKRELKFG